MLTTNETIELYKKIKSEYKKIQSEKFSNNENNIYDMFNKLIFKTNNDDNKNLCDHVLCLKNDGTYYCPNCKEEFIKVDNSIYRKKDIINGEKFLVDFAGLPVVPTIEENYLSILYLRACAMDNINGPVKNPQVIKKNIIDLKTKDDEYQVFIDEEFNKGKNMDKVIKMDFDKRFGLY